MRFEISKTEQSDAHRSSSNRARAQWRKDHPKGTRYTGVPTRFASVDGEGTTMETGEHRYVLLGVGDQHVSNPDGLTWQECFEFLWSQFKTGSVAYTGFFLSYDFIQMLRTLAEDRARMLLTAEGRKARTPKSQERHNLFPVRCDGWEFDILGTRRLKIRKEGSERWMSICDTGSFFQKSFLKVIDPAEWSDPVVTPEEYATIARGKSNRSTAVLDSDMLAYNRLENEILSRVLCKLNEGFQSLGVSLKPNQWFGPGQAAQQWLTGRAPTSKDLNSAVPQDALLAARASYFGGWFEITAHGHIPAITYEYDINSAYPYIISALPCLMHGEWSHNEQSPGTRYTLVRARVCGSDPYLGAMLHRDESGNISRPSRTQGWYWRHELDAAGNAGLVSRAEILESWSYYPCSCPPPIAEIADLYAKRLAVGKKTPLGMAIKLLINSCYGKFAQSIGSPKFANPVYASLITAGCRAIDLNAIASHTGGTRDVLMVATDGVYFKRRHESLALSSRLGDWEETAKQNMCLFKPGVYWDDKARRSITAGESPVFKARGVSA
ncbi:MAG TPA: DNA polymerase, partial [Candidatus Paceibacterota bacterium]